MCRGGGDTAEKISPGEAIPVDDERRARASRRREGVESVKARRDKNGRVVDEVSVRTGGVGLR